MYRSRSHLLFAVVVTAGVCALSTAAVAKVMLRPQTAGASVRATAAQDGVEWQDADGVTHTIVHAAATDDPELRIVGPVTTSKGVFYAVRGDLLRVSLEERAVVERHFFGAQIQGLRPTKAGGLEVKLDLNRRDESVPEHAWFPAFASKSAPLFVPGNGRWGLWIKSAFRPLRDLPDGLDDKLFASLPKTSAGLAELDQRLAAVVETDRTNGQAHAYRAVIADADGRPADVARHLDAALQSPGATWFDLYRFCSMAHVLRQPALAKRGCAAAAADLAARGIRKEAVTDPVALAADMRVAGRQVERAIAEENVALAKTLMGMMDQAYPRIDGSENAYALFSDWLAAKGDPAATEWAQRARHNVEQTVVDAPQTRRDLNRFSWLWIGIHLALIPIGLIVGIRSGRRLREQARKRAAPKSWRTLLPIPTATDAAFLLALLVVLLVASSSIVDRMTRVEAYTQIPISVTMDTLDSPDVLAWGAAEEQLVAPQRALVAYAKGAFENAKKGEGPQGAKPSPTIVREILEAKVEASTFASKMAFVSDNFSPVASFVVVLFALMLAFAGHALAFRKPLLTRALQAFVVGAAPRLDLVAPLLLTFLALGVIAKDAAGTIAAQLEVPFAPKLYGLDALVRPPFAEGSVASEIGMNVGHEPTDWTTWWILGIFLLHGIFVVIDAAAWWRERKATKK